MKDTCVVTGGSGFIGSHLCGLLLNRGFRVVCIDNLLSGRRENVLEFNKNSDFTFILFDLTKPLSDAVVKELNQAKYVFHLASPASPNAKSKISYYQNPIETLLVNSYGTYQLLNSVLTSKAHFLFASTSEIYGDPLIHPQKESYFGNVNPVGERSCYDEAKRFGEAITATYVKNKEVNGRIIRIFNTYGPNMHKDDGRAVVEFISKALKGEALPIFGKGDQTRSFCYVSDMVEGIYKAMFNDSTLGEVINLGNPQEITVLEIADKIIALTGSKSRLKFESLPHDDPKRRKPDITKAISLLKWNPTVSLEEGLSQTVNYFKNYK